MSSWHAIICVCIALGFAVYLKRALGTLDSSVPVDEMDVRLWRLKHDRMAQGECIYCGAALADGRVRSTLTSSVCAHCAPHFNP